MAMADMIGCNDKEQAALNALGKTITSLTLRDDYNDLLIGLEDGSVIRVRDHLELCCERRYMRTDDHLTDYLGARLIEMEVLDVARGEDHCPDSKWSHEIQHEIQFVVIHTDKGDITLSDHNEHNGYYSGFNAIVESYQQLN